MEPRRDIFIMDLVTVAYMGPKMIFDILKYRTCMLQKISLGEEHEN